MAYLWIFALLAVAEGINLQHIQQESIAKAKAKASTINEAVKKLTSSARTEGPKRAKQRVNNAEESFLRMSYTYDAACLPGSGGDVIWNEYRLGGCQPTGDTTTPSVSYGCIVDETDTTKFSVYAEGYATSDCSGDLTFTQIYYSSSTECHMADSDDDDNDNGWPLYYTAQCAAATSDFQKENNGMITQVSSCADGLCNTPFFAQGIYDGACMKGTDDQGQPTNSSSTFECRDNGAAVEVGFYEGTTCDGNWLQTVVMPLQTSCTRSADESGCQALKQSCVASD